MARTLTPLLPQNTVKPESKSARKASEIRPILLFIIVAAGLALRFAIPVPDGLDARSWSLLLLVLGALIGLIVQPAPIGILFLSAITAAALMGILTPAQALAGYSNNILWLIVISFMFARAFVKTGLGRRIALMIIRRIGSSTLRLGYSLSIADLILAPVTASNTARTGAIVFPVAVSLAEEFGSYPGPTSKKMGSYLLFTAFQANLVTSSLFLTAMASNPLAAEFARQIAGAHITWGSWLAASSIPGLVSFILVPYFIHRQFCPEITETPEAPRFARAELEKIGAATRHEKILIATFASLAAIWATSALHGIDTTIAGLAALCVLMWTEVLNWNDIIDERRAWDTFIWWGAMLSLVTALNQSLVSKWFTAKIGGSLTGLAPFMTLVILVVAYTYIHYGFAGQTAHIVALYAPFLTIAVAAGAPPLLASLLLCFFSNLNSTLTPYSDGAAPIYYGSNYIGRTAWWRTGFYLSILHLMVWLGVGLPWWKFLKIW